MAADERRDNRLLTQRVSWLNMSVYAPEGRKFVGTHGVYHGQLTSQICADERCSQHGVPLADMEIAPPLQRLQQIRRQIKFTWQHGLARQRGPGEKIVREPAMDLAYGGQCLGLAALQPQRGGQVVP
jgi:hypothetical protein